MADELNRGHNPLAGRFVALELEGSKRANWCRLYAPERPRLIVGAIPSIADPVPPSTALAPSRENGVDSEAATFKGEFDWGGRPIDKNFPCGNDFARHVRLLLYICLNIRTDVRKIAHPTDKGNAQPLLESFRRVLSAN
jgi:hypothetical protein